MNDNTSNDTVDQIITLLGEIVIYELKKKEGVKND